MDTVKHYIQDACEKLVVWKLTQLAQHDKLAINNDSQQKKREYEKYCDERSLIAEGKGKTKGFRTYLDIFTFHVPQFYKELKENYPCCKFDFIDVEAQYRNEKKKGDFVIKVVGEQEAELSFSLKAYGGAGGISQPQLCSGTFNSFVNNFLFESAGVGTFVSRENKIFPGKRGIVRDNEIIKLGKEKILPLVHRLDDIQIALKQKYAKDPRYAWWSDKIGEEWVNDCREWGHLGADLIYEILGHFTNDQIKNRIIEMIGFDATEEMFFMDKKKMVNSLTNSRLKDLRSAVVDKKTTIKYYRHEKNLKFDFVDSLGTTILAVNIPFTLNRNGAFHLPEGHKRPRYSKTDKMVVEYGQRRPKKSQQITTSINTYTDFAAAGIV